MSKLIPSQFRFKECLDCINRILDPFQCEGCENANNYEVESEEAEADGEEMTYAEFMDYCKDIA